MISFHHFNTYWSRKSYKFKNFQIKKVSSQQIKKMARADKTWNPWLNERNLDSWRKIMQYRYIILTVVGWALYFRKSRKRMASEFCLLQSYFRFSTGDGAEHHPPGVIGLTQICKQSHLLGSRGCGSNLRFYICHLNTDLQKIWSRQSRQL